jgi:PAS domain S-box-containing protein
MTYPADMSSGGHRAWWSLALDAVGDAVTVTDRHGRITFWNGAAADVFGWKGPDVVGGSIRDVTADGITVAQANDIRATLMSGEPWSSELKIRRRDGSTITVAVTATPVMGHDGIEAVIAVSRDLTERRELEARLHQAERLESLGKLTGGVAHDFNNLLTVILSYGSFIADASDDEMRENGRQITAAAEGAARLAQQLIAFARNEPIASYVLDLNAIVAESRDLLDHAISMRHNLVIRVHDIPSIRANRTHVEQVLMNLVVNARDSMLHGGTLTIETGVVLLEPGDDRLETSMAAGDYVRLTVSDTGEGMSEYVASRALEPFFSTKPKGSGSGLGLATVHGIVTESGGSVRIRSVEGAGTSIDVYLPSVSEEPPVEVPTRPSPRMQIPSPQRSEELATITPPGGAAGTGADATWKS